MSNSIAGAMVKMMIQKAEENIKTSQNCILGVCPTPGCNMPLKESDRVDSLCDYVECPECLEIHHVDDLRHTNCLIDIRD